MERIVKDCEIRKEKSFCAFKNCVVQYNHSYGVMLYKWYGFRHPSVKLSVPILPATLSIYTGDIISAVLSF